MPDYRFPKKMRLLRARDFERVLRLRTSTSDATIIVYAAPNDLAFPRLGLTVSRKIGSAVARNRWKRALREAFRITQHELPTLDLVCLPRQGAKPDVAQLIIVLPKLIGRLADRLAKVDPSPETSRL